MCYTGVEFFLRGAQIRTNGSGRINATDIGDNDDDAFISWS